MPQKIYDYLFRRLLKGLIRYYLAYLNMGKKSESHSTERRVCVHVDRDMWISIVGTFAQAVRRLRISLEVIKLVILGKNV